MVGGRVGDGSGWSLEDIFTLPDDLEQLDLAAKGPGNPHSDRGYSGIVRSVSAAALRRGIIRFTSHLPRPSHQPQEGAFLQVGYAGGDRCYCARLSLADPTGNDDWSNRPSTRVEKRQSSMSPESRIDGGNIADHMTRASVVAQSSVARRRQMRRNHPQGCLQNTTELVNEGWKVPMQVQDSGGRKSPKLDWL